MPAMKHSELAARLVAAKDMIDQAIKLSGMEGVAPEGAVVNQERIQADSTSQIDYAGFTIPTPSFGESPSKESSLFPGTVAESGFKFGRKSIAELSGVKSELIQMATKALQYSVVDFMVFDGLRTEEEQRAYVKAGTSKTMKSKHIKQVDGFGHAVDLVPIVGGIPKWDWALIYKIVVAVDRAATELGIADNIRWGGAWDCTLGDISGDARGIEQAVKDYCKRHAGSDFIDGPHFEWIS